MEKNKITVEVGMNREARRAKKKGKLKVVRNVVAVPILTAAILLSQMYGCSALANGELVEMIQSGRDIELEVYAPSEYKIHKPRTGQFLQELQWVQLDQSRMYKSTVRDKVDRVLNIKTVKNKSLTEKSGVLYVGAGNKRNGNTSLEDALRNKVFVTKYWNSSNVKSSLSKIGRDTFKDLGTGNGVMAALNAYYSLVPDYNRPTGYYGTMPLTREQFHAMVYKSENGVSNIKYDTKFEKVMGGRTQYTKFTVKNINKGYLQTADGSMNSQTYKEFMTKGEAVYMMISNHFADKVKNYDGELSGYVNSGDLSDKLGIKGQLNETKNTLAYMIKSEEKELSSKVYKALAYAEKLGIIDGSTFRFGEVISKEESLKLVVDTHLAKNKVYGYATTSEYGKNTPASFKVALDPDGAIGVDEAGRLYGKDWANASGVKALTLETKINGVTVKELQGIIKSIEGNGTAFVNLYMKTYFPGYTVAQIKAVKAPVTVKKATTKKTSTTTKGSSGKKYTKIPAAFYTWSPEKQLQFMEDNYYLFNSADQYMGEVGVTPGLTPGTGNIEEYRERFGGF